MAGGVVGGRLHDAGPLLQDGLLFREEVTVSESLAPDTPGTFVTMTTGDTYATAATYDEMRAALAAAGARILPVGRAARAESR